MVMEKAMAKAGVLPPQPSGAAEAAPAPKLQTVSSDDILGFVKERLAAATKARSEKPHQVYALERALAEYTAAHERRAMLALAAQLGMPVALPNLEDLALAVWQAAEALPENTGRPSREVVAPLMMMMPPARQQALPAWPEDEGGPFVPRYPNIWHAVHERGLALVLIGGVPVLNKINWVRRLMGVSDDIHADTAPVQWIGTEDDRSAKAFDALANRMRARTVAAVVVFPEFSSHAQTTAAMAAGRECGVPVVPGGKAGQAALLTAFEQIDRELTLEAETAR